jgi:Fe-S oxidoreductase
MVLPLETSEEDQTKILVHGRCHQKAVGAMKSMRKVLKKIPGLKFEMIEASCCGMAGSFGVEAEHVDYAQQIAELELIPALNAEPQAHSSRCPTNLFRMMHWTASLRWKVPTQKTLCTTLRAIFSAVTLNPA